MSLATMLRVAMATGLALTMARRGLKKKSLDTSGALAAFAVGFASMASGYRFGALLIGFYFSSSKFTNVKAEVKQRLDENFKIGGQRSARQVLACSFLASAIAVYCAWCFGSTDFARFDFAQAPLESALLAAYIGHYACCAADTWASELGVLSKSDPVLITSLRRVPPGTNGGVSVVGTLASAGGGVFVGVLYYIFSLVTGSAQVQVIVLSAVMGIVGSLLDSVLGATLQATWYDTKTKKICTEGRYCIGQTGRYVKHVCGFDVLTNEQVNAVSVVATTLLSVPVAQFLF